MVSPDIAFGNVKRNTAIFVLSFCLGFPKKGYQQNLFKIYRNKIEIINHKNLYKNLVKYVVSTKNLYLFYKFTTDFFTSCLKVFLITKRRNEPKAYKNNVLREKKATTFYNKSTILQFVSKAKQNKG